MILLKNLNIKMKINNTLKNLKKLEKKIILAIILKKKNK